MFILSTLFFSVRTRLSAVAIKVSGLVQSVGYLVVTFGPPIFERLHDWDSSWRMSFYFLAVCIVIMFLFGLHAATNKYVEDTVN